MGFLQNPCVLCILITTLFMLIARNCAEDRKDYIVYMGKLPELSDYSPMDHHHNILQDVIEEDLQADRLLIRSYGKSFNGFSAKLTENERQKIAGMKGIVSVFPCETLELHTTKSWDFMGFDEQVKRNTKVESDVIIGVIDTGIWLESESFNDKGFGPPPKKWKGVCEGGLNFTCNNKIIGARYYTDDENNARDTVGHGTHTASTAAGNLVKQASFFGVAQGNARGAVPLSRIAVYKACSLSGCRSDFILSAFDDAISDGVDILSVSLGSKIPRIFELDVIAIGGFHAMLRGILTSNSAGNSGPSPATTGSTAPWLFSVAASTTDRLIIDKVVLGDNTTLTGSAINSFDLKRRKFPLISGAQATNGRCSDSDARQCISGCFIKSKVQGKILLCENNTTPGVELDLNATGAILTNYEGDVPRVSFIPSSRLKLNDIATVFSYVTTAKNPEATILKSESIVDASAPQVSSFSSRGPSLNIPEILKPDIAAPGVDILAAWPTSISPTGSRLDTRSVKYNIISGTSMSCPHVSGAAAYVKTFHLDWSPAAIKSALMTTAVPMNATRNADAEFSYGSGFINPVKALNPGLVYDASEDDYIKMLCSIGYTSEMIKFIAGKISSCPSKYNGTAMDLNYPSMAMTNSTKEAVFTRTVTNVGVANSTYRATVASPSYVIVSVEPKVLSFKSLNEKQSFIVKVSLKDPPGEVLVASASLVWSDGIHSVRSPIAASFWNIS